MARSDEPLDTTADSAAYQAQLYAEMTPAKRLETALEMSVLAREMTLAGLRRRNPGLGESELRARLIELCCGSAASR